jgi:putative NADPH-quinone reductase
MNILILQGHPDTSDEPHFDHALAEAYAEAARASGHQVELLRVATLDVPLMRSEAQWHAEPPDSIKAVQAKMQTADHLVLVFPLWMGMLPASFKAFLEQVLRPGFAFGGAPKPGQHGVLRGKSARVIITMGMPGIFYRWFYRAHAYHALRRNILKFCGIKPVRGSLIGMVDNARQRQRWLQKVAALGRRGV